MQIEQDLLRLKDLDRRVVRAVLESNVDALTAAINEFLPLRRRLNAQVLEEAVVTIQNDEARATLKAIKVSD